MELGPQSFQSRDQFGGMNTLILIWMKPVRELQNIRFATEKRPQIHFRLLPSLVDPIEFPSP